jgi:tellurite resistance protein TerC
MSPLLLGPLLVTLGLLLLADVLLFARGREPTFRESAAWSVGWLLLGLGVALPIWALGGGDRGLEYLTVYLIERSLSLDNLFVFLLIFAYFGVPHAHRGKLLLYGIVLALAMRGLAIVTGVELIERFHFVLYVLGAMLLYLAYRMLRGVAEHTDPGDTAAVRLVRRLLPVTDGFRAGRFVVREHGRRSATPLMLALAAIVAADIAFAVDSIPAAFAITTDSLVIWIANAFALLGLRSLFALVQSLARRLKYLDETIAVVLALVAVKLLVEDLIHIGPVASLALVVAVFAVGVIASLIGDRRDPAGAAERRAKRAPSGEGAGTPVTGRPASAPRGGEALG